MTDGERTFAGLGLVFYMLWATVQVRARRQRKHWRSTPSKRALVRLSGLSFTFVSLLERNDVGVPGWAPFHFFVVYMAYPLCTTLLLLSPPLLT